jgi:hypothetical protein
LIYEQKSREPCGSLLLTFQKVLAVVVGGAVSDRPYIGKIRKTRYRGPDDTGSFKRGRKMKKKITSV